MLINVSSLSEIIEGVLAEIENKIIENKKSVKLLGVITDDKLSFEERILKICNKVSSKLHALSRIPHFLSTHKLKVIMKSFIESQFTYCPPVWMFHKQKTE